MKKTLLLLSALAGLAAAEESTVYVSYTNDIYISNVDHTISATTKHGDKSISVPNPTVSCTEAFNSNVGNVVQANLNGGESFSSTFNFPVQLSGASYTIDNITLSYGLHKEDGSLYKLEDYLAEYKEKNSLGDEDSVEYPEFTFTMTLTGKDIAGNSKSYTKTINTLVDDVALTKYTTGFNWEDVSFVGAFTMEVVVRSADADFDDNLPIYLSMDTIRVTGEAPLSVPEPATVTLSLLALARLAARRRRK